MIPLKNHLTSMKPYRVHLAVAVGCLALATVCWPRVSAQVHGAAPYEEYLTIRWGGNNTHVIRPGGKVEFIGPELRKFPTPRNCDERSFVMNVAMNGLVKEGWEFAGMTSDDIIMKRRRQ
ncbi:MAG: hypothetical protein WCR07_00280 [Verrucomicrobiota bacterium]|jgi:hypothetical protein